MSNLSKTLEDMQNMAQSAQSIFATLPESEAQATHFWRAQDTFLKEFEKFSAAWFKRRHEGTQLAMEVSKQLVERAAVNPTEAASILADWQSHSMERLAEDAKNYMEMVSGCAAAAVANEVEAVEETVETTKRATKTAKSQPV